MSVVSFSLLFLRSNVFFYFKEPLLQFSHPTIRLYHPVPVSHRIDKQNGNRKKNTWETSILPFTSIFFNSLILLDLGWALKANESMRGRIMGVCSRVELSWVDKMTTMKMKIEQEGVSDRKTAMIDVSEYELSVA